MMTTGRVVHLRLASTGVSAAVTVNVTANGEEMSPSSVTKPETKNSGTIIFAIPLELVG